MRILILGAGRQGTAAAFDLAREGARSIVLADRSYSAARASAERVDALAGRPVARAVELFADDLSGVRQAMEEADITLSAVPYYFNVALSKVALEARRHFVDMGGNTEVVRQQLALHEAAKAAGVAVLPDCGMGPGLVNVLAVYAMDHLDVAREVYVCDGGLPQDPTPPWNYLCAFHLNGLTNEYDGTVPLLRDGKIVEIEALGELRTEDLGPLGRFESFIAAGGSTAPWSFEGRLERFETRILRYPGHHAWFAGFKALGLFGESPVQVGEQQVVPRAFYHTLLARHITAPSFKDLCLMHCRAVGTKAGRAASVVVTVVDRYDEATGFTAMERLTGYHCAIMMKMITEGRVPAGARALEALLLDRTPTAAAVMAAVAARGIQFNVQEEATP